MDCSTPGLPVHHHLLELTQTHVHLVSDDIQPSHPLLSSSPPALNLSQHQVCLHVSNSETQVNVLTSYSPRENWRFEGTISCKDGHDKGQKQ